MNAFDLAQRFIGIKEFDGTEHNHQIMAMLKLDNSWPGEDEVPWCSAFTNYICWLSYLPRSESLRARSWLRIGYRVELEDAAVCDIVVLKQQQSDPGVEVIETRGHVGFYAGHDATHVEVLGGNQSDSVNISRYHISKLLSVRRLTS